MYPVSSELYLETLAHLTEVIGNASYYSGTLNFTYQQVECRLTASVIVYRSSETLPEGDVEVISDLIPVWWEFHTTVDDTECPNDFSFSCVRQIL